MEADTPKKTKHWNGWGHAERKRAERMSCELLRYTMALLQDLRDRNRLSKTEHEIHMSRLFEWSMQ
jgi:hypothetical protein